MFFTKKFPLINEVGQEVGIVVLEHLWADTYGIRIKKTEFSTRIDQWMQALHLALTEADALSAEQVLFRLIKADGLSELSKVLPSLGFRKKLDRIEFRRLLTLLPDDDSGSPLSWRTAYEMNWSEQEIANTLECVAQDDPDTDAKDNPIKFIQDFLADPVLTAGLECIHIGFIDDHIAAMTVVQMNPKSGWSRISYMGVAPEFRQQGLGKWVHRYSFKTMKNLGGKLYHGGTSATNHAMLRLFEIHQCELFLEMEEWICKKTTDRWFCYWSHLRHLVNNPRWCK